MKRFILAIILMFTFIVNFAMPVYALEPPKDTNVEKIEEIQNEISEKIEAVEKAEADKTINDLKDKIEELKEENKESTSTDATTTGTTNETNTQDNVEDERNNDYSTQFFLIIFCIGVPFAVVIFTTMGSKSEDAIRVVTNFVNDNDKSTRDKFQDIKDSVDNLAEKHPEIIKSEEYQALLSKLIETNTFLISESERKQNINAIYRTEFNVLEKEVSEYKNFRMCGFRVIPYKTKEEYEKIQKEYPTVKEDFNTTPTFMSYVFLKKDGTFVAKFEFKKTEKRDFVEISYIKTEELSAKMFGNILCSLTDYTYENFGGIYFFVNIDKEDKETKQMVKKYGFKKCSTEEREGYYYYDKNAEIGSISIINI